jgi:hypothetical protein
LHQACKERGLREGQPRGRGAEVVLGGGLDAVRTVAEVGKIEVTLEDLVLGQRLLDGDGVPELPDLARVAGVLRGPDGGGIASPLGLLDQDHLYVLLGQGGAALGNAAAD